MGRERNLTVEEWQDIQRRRIEVTAGELNPHYGGLPRGANPILDGERLKPRSRMNKTEYAYSLELEARRQTGEILWWGFEKITLKLADDCRFTPDFALWWVPTIGADPQIQFIEIKGFLREDAALKFKIAAEQFPWAEFFMYRKQKGGGWELMKHLNGSAR